MKENEKKLFDILNIFNEANVLKDLIVIGSWSLSFYEHVFNNFDPLIRTTDIDFYIPKPKSIKESHSLINALKNVNYDVFFDILSNKSTFISSDGFEIEFLTSADRSEQTCIKIAIPAYTLKHYLIFPFIIRTI